MPGTHTQLLYHIVFSTKERRPWITDDIAARLHPYIGGVIKTLGGVACSVGGVEDHVHLYLRWKPDEPLSDLMRTVKSRSSKWVHATYTHLSEFAWQQGYAAFSVSKSREGAVRTYIANQREHHRRADFKTELERLLHSHGVAYDRQYLH